MPHLQRRLFLAELLNEIGAIRGAPPLWPVPELTTEGKRGKREEGMKRGDEKREEGRGKREDGKKRGSGDPSCTTSHHYSLYSLLSGI